MSKLTLPALALGVMLSAQAANAQLLRPDLSETKRGRLQGLQTRSEPIVGHTIKGYSVVGRRVELTVTAIGYGRKPLTVRVERYTADDGKWKRVAGMSISPGSTSTMSYDVADFDPNYTELYRIRVSRKLGTQKVRWILTKKNKGLLQ